MSELEIKGKVIFTNKFLPKEVYLEAIDMSNHFKNRDKWRRFSLQVKGYSYWKLGLKECAYKVFLTLLPIQISKKIW